MRSPGPGVGIGGVFADCLRLGARIFFRVVTMQITQPDRCARVVDSAAGVLERYIPDRLGARASPGLDGEKRALYLL